VLITSRKPGSDDPYIRVEVSFKETVTPDLIWPAFHILRAGLIVLERKAAGLTA
jgi:hypothetical protein